VLMAVPLAAELEQPVQPVSEARLAGGRLSRTATRILRLVARHLPPIS
jgi:hypothetical protein